MGLTDEKQLGCRWRDLNPQPLNINRGRSQVYLDGVLHQLYIIFVITHMCLTSNPRSKLFSLDTGSPGISRREAVMMLIENLGRTSP